MAPRATGRAVSMVALAATTVVATVVVATVATTSVLGGPSRSGGGDGPDKGPAGRIDRPPLDAPSVPDWLGNMLLIVLALSVIAVTIFIRHSRRHAGERLQYEEDDPERPDWEAQITAQLSEAAIEQLRLLREGEPRNAIVACWLRLQGAAAQAGLPAERAETSTEFTVRALRRLPVDSRAIGTLSELYREARFSIHPMGETQRGQALVALGVLADQLSRPPVAGDSGSPRTTALDSVTP